MTGEQLKTWRTHRNLSQAELAELLGWTRDQVANVELERTTMKENIEHKLAQADESLRRRPAAAPIVHKGKDYSAHRCWNSLGQPITWAYIKAQPLGYQFYRLDNSKNVHPTTGHQLANLYVITRKQPNGECKSLALDLDDWRIICIAYPDHPLHVEWIPKLNARLGQKPADNPQPETNPNFFL